MSDPEDRAGAQTFNGEGADDDSVPPPSGDTDKKRNRRGKRLEKARKEIHKNADGGLEAVKSESGRIKVLRSEPPESHAATTAADATVRSTDHSVTPDMVTGAAAGLVLVYEVGRIFFKKLARRKRRKD